MRIVDPSKDLNSYGLGNVDWKERVESWKLKQDKNMMQVTSKYVEGKAGGDIEGTGSNGEDIQMYAFSCLSNLLHILLAWWSLKNPTFHYTHLLAIFSVP